MARIVELEPWFLSNCSVSTIKTFLQPPFAASGISVASLRSLGDDAVNIRHASAETQGRCAESKREKKQKNKRISAG